jgi:DNA-binding SARP family transcriptional activator/tetratricopeptide (TPR) repeat protein
MASPAEMRSPLQSDPQELEFRRPRVDAAIAAAWRRRVTLVIAGGGYGKTTALRGLETGGPVSWLGVRAADAQIELLVRRLADCLGLAPAGLQTPAAIGAEDRDALAEAAAVALCEAIERDGAERLLILDDFDLLPDGGPGLQLIRALCLQAPRALHIVLSGRRMPALGLGRGRAAGEMLELGAPELAFTQAETVDLLRARLGPEHESLAARCMELSGGWAAALRLIIEGLERLDPGARAGALATGRLLGGGLWRELVADLLEHESDDSRLALDLAAVAPVVDPSLLGAAGVEAAGEVIEGLRVRGLLVAGGRGEGRTLSPALGELVVERLPAHEAERLRELAAAWLEAAGRLGEALDCRLGGPADAARAFLLRRGYELIDAGFAGRVAEAARVIEGDELDALMGAALEAGGDWDAAIECFAQLDRRSGAGALPAAVAWRYGALLYFRGETRTATEVLSRAQAENGGGADDALVSAWLASTLWSSGSVQEAASAAAVALRQGEQAGDARAQAAAHVAAALVAASRGDRGDNDRHYRAALAAAERGRDSMQLTRIHANLSSRAVEEGDYAGAIRSADAALGVGAGHRFFAAVALGNKAEALMSIGELDAALESLTASIDVGASLGATVEAEPYCLLGTLHRERGELARARVAFERALRLAEQAEDAHTLAHALIGLARTLADEDPDAARAHAARAIELASSLELADAHCAAAWVELRAGERAAAARLAEQAEAEARATGDRPALARALALEGLSCTPPSPQRLEAAVELWSELGNAVALDRTRLALAVLQGDEVAADRLRAALEARGVSPGAGLLSGPPEGAGGGRAIELTTLGRFVVSRNGERVAPSQWQSRKARDLLKLLVGRRGRAITREAAAEALWPGEAPGPLANRLSVALSTLRKVLDPGRERPQDHYISSDGNSLALRTDRVTVDVLEFLTLATEATALAAAEDWSRAEVALADAERLYAGDFLEEDLYEDWAVDCRETARSAALEVSRLLARRAAQCDDDETASRHLRRLIERDGYDEDAWTALVGALTRLRRYGEARRQHVIYARRMAEIGIAPVALQDAAEARP